MLDPMKLRAYDLTVADVADALAAQNLQMPSGSMKVGETRIYAPHDGPRQQHAGDGRITSPTATAEPSPSATWAAAEDSTEEIKSVSLYNDTPCVLMNIRKQSGTNTVAVATALKERLAELRKPCPKTTTSK